MRQIRRNVAAVKAMQQQYELHGAREMKEMETELKRLSRGDLTVGLIHRRSATSPDFL
jgi:hypothetical protein